MTKNTEVQTGSVYEFVGEDGDFERMEIVEADEKSVSVRLDDEDDVSKMSERAFRALYFSEEWTHVY